jgi:cyclophilin family peptidyl-prolyl cis-trans isomerase
VKSRRRSKSIVELEPVVELLERRELMIVGGASLQAVIPPAFTNGAAPLTVNIGSNFADTAVNGSFVDMNTTQGHLYFQLDTGREPVPSNNFLAYVNAGRYDNTVFDRSVGSRPDTTQFGPTQDDSFISGGGFTTAGTSVTTGADAPIPDTWAIEDSNQKGFIGFARVGNDPNSAKSEFYINRTDNSTLFDGKTSFNPTGDPLGGFTIFGQLVFSTISNATLGAIAGIATPNADNTAAPLYPQVPGSVDPTGLATILSAKQALPLKFSVATDNAAVTASIGGTSLNPTVVLNSAPGSSGTVNITVTATALDDSSSATGTFALTFDTTPPTAALTAAVTPPAFHDTGVDINVTFTDNNALNSGTIGNGDIVVTGPDAQSHPATLVSSTVNGAQVQATFHYTASAPLTFHDNGTYTLTIPSGKFTDAAGNSNSDIPLESFAINLDGDGPTAQAGAAGSATAGSTTIDFPVNFFDATAVKVSTLSGHTVNVTGPLPGENFTAILQAAPAGDGPNVTATYRLDLGHRATIADNGNYAVSLPAGIVTDTLDNPNLPAAIGSFALAVETNPPTAQLAAFTAPLNRAASTTFTILYSDDTGVDPATIASDNFTIVGPGGISYPVTLAGMTSAGSDVMASYTFVAPHGTFSPADDGTYHLTLRGGGVADTFANTASAGEFGSFTLDIDGTPPTVASVLASPVGRRSPFERFAVTYSDDRAIGSTTLGNDDVLVTGPEGFSQNATFVSFTQLDAAHVQANYRIDAPAGGFAVDTTFNLTTNEGAVTDVGGNPLAVTALGSFTVSADGDPPAVSAAPPANEGGVETMDFTLTFTDATGVDDASIGTAAVTLSGPHGFSQPAVFVGTRDLDAHTTVASYRVTAPHHFFGIADNGGYSASIAGGFIDDVLSNPLDATSAPFTLAIPKPPVAPMLVSDLSVTPKSISPSTKNVAALKLANVGTRAAGGIALVKLYISTDGQFDSSDMLISTTRSRISIKPKAAATLPIKFAMPAKVADGRYQIIAIVDPNNTLAEQYATGHNAVSTPVAVKAPFVDVAGILPNLPKTVKSGAKTPFTLTLANKGNVPVKGTAKIQLFASEQLTLDAATALKLGVISKPLNIAVGKTALLPLSFSVTGLGTDYIVAVITFPGDKLTGNNTVFSTNIVKFV